MEQFQKTIEILNPCMDDYLYILDINNDCFCISENAVERFDISENQFCQVTENLKKLTYPDDAELILKDLDQIENHGKLFHNLQYRWKDKEGKPIWIN